MIKKVHIRCSAMRTRIGQVGWDRRQNTDGIVNQSLFIKCVDRNQALLTCVISFLLTLPRLHQDLLAPWSMSCTKMRHFSLPLMNLVQFMRQNFGKGNHRWWLYIVKYPVGGLDMCDDGSYFLHRRVKYEKQNPCQASQKRRSIELAN